MRNLLLKFMIVAATFCWGTTFADEIDTKTEKLLYPIVRVRTARAGGSGTVIYSEDREEKGVFKTFILTNYHVIDDAVKIEKKWDNLRQAYVNEERNDQVSVEIFEWSKGTIVSGKTVKADIVAHKAEEDIAVLQLDYRLQVPNVATILDSDDKLRVFQKIYVVGCSLGHDPIHTSGEITDLNDKLDGKDYMMGSALVIFGNSGGAVFTDVDNKFVFVGIPARVAVSQGAGAITHMNWFVPLSRVQEFIKTQKLDFLHDAKRTPTESFKERSKLREKSDSEKGGEGGVQRQQEQHDHGDGDRGF